MDRESILKDTIEHIDITAFDATPMIDAMGKMAFQARNLADAAWIYERMIEDPDCTIILCLAGSLFSAGLKEVVCELVDSGMVDAIVSTGALMMDQDLFEALGYRHYTGTSDADDGMLRRNHIDRIYDTYIDEDELRMCDMTIAAIADDMSPGVYSSREFLARTGRYLEEHPPECRSVVLEAYRHDIPIFVPAFSDSSAGFGLLSHRNGRGSGASVAIDSVKDFRELTSIKIASGETGLVMIGGGAPKNFAQDTTVAAEILGENVKMHRYAIQITVADERDGALSGSTLKEAHSWGKVELDNTGTVFSEATIAFPLIASYVYHAGGWKGRKERRLSGMFREV